MTLRNTLTQRETESGRAVPHLSACVAELGLGASSLTFAPGTCSLHLAKLPSKACDFETFGFREKWSREASSVVCSEASRVRGPSLQATLEPEVPPCVQVCASV